MPRRQRVASARRRGVRPHAPVSGGVPRWRRFLAAVPPLEQKQCLRAALIHDVRRFLNLQSQGVVRTPRPCGAYGGRADAAGRARGPSASVLRRDSQPGSGLTAFPFVDESRFQSAEESVADGVAPAPPAPGLPFPQRPVDASFGSYPNWWPLNNVVKASEAAAEATRQAAAPKRNVDEKNQRSSDRTSPEKSEKQPPDASEQEKGNPPGSRGHPKKTESLAIPGARH